MNLFQEMVLKIHPIIGGHFENHAVIFVVGQISNVPIANNVLKGILYLCTNFHAFIVKGTIHLNIAHISCTNVNVVISHLVVLCRSSSCTLSFFLY